MFNKEFSIAVCAAISLLSEVASAQEPPVIPNWRMKSESISCPRQGQFTVSIKSTHGQVTLSELSASGTKVKDADRIKVNRVLQTFDDISGINIGCLSNGGVTVGINGASTRTKAQFVTFSYYAGRIHF
jgi:hypothetical protein